MQTKTCCQCKVEKPLTDFAFRNKETGKLQNHCKECQKKYSSKSYYLNRESNIKRSAINKAIALEKMRSFILEYLLGHPCVDCGNEDPIVLEFDHVRGTKHLAVSEMVRMGYGENAITEEILKCEIRCANCHKKRHHYERLKNKNLKIENIL